MKSTQSRVVGCREGGKVVRCEAGAAARAGVVQGLPGCGEADFYSKGHGKPQQSFQQDYDIT